MINWSINNRVLFIALFPLVLISFALNTYFTITRFTEMQDSLSKQGNTLAFHIAAASEYGVNSGNTAFLEKLAKTALSAPEITKVTITDINADTLVSINKNINDELGDNQFFYFIYQLLNFEREYLIFQRDIVSEKTDVTDYRFNSEQNPIAQPNSDIIGYATVYISLKLSTYRQIISTIKSNMILLLIFLLSVYLALRLSDEISRSISNISKTVRRIESGDLHARANVYTSGEIGELSRGINKMADALQDSDMHLRIEIDKATTNLRNSYIEIEKQNKRLIHARSTADSANQAKSNFLANISHEIRTPINGVIGFTDVLLKTSLSQQQKEYINTIRTASNSLMHLITDLLDFARIESGKMTIESVTFDILSVIENIHTLYSNSAYQKGLELLVEFDKKLPNKLISDPARIEQVLINLVSNAIKFTKTGRIEINVSLNSSSYDEIELKCSVSDTGIGLSKKEARRIFDEYEQAGSSTTRHYGGTGLGLSITKHIVELLNGKIHVDSKKNQGSTFCFTIKCGYSDQETDITSYNYNDRTIYLVDTQPRSQDLYMRLFRSIGFNTIDASDPAIIDIAGENTKKSILIFSIDARCNLDYDFSGLLDNYRHFPIEKIAFVSSNNPDIHQTLIGIGFDYVISKTINRTQLLNAFSANLISRYGVVTENNHDKNQQKRQTNINVLVVDDNDINVKILEAYLKPMNINPITANNGKNALALLEQKEISLIFMDLHMPVMDGYETTRSIRQLKSDKRKIPIIGITADGLQESMQKCIDVGMNQCLVKPIAFQDIEGIVNTWLFNIAGTKKTKPAIHIGDELTGMLINELPTFRDQLIAAKNENDIDAMFHIAHKISGGSAYCNLPELRSSSLKLQSVTRNQNTCDQSQNKFDEPIDQLLKAIDQLIIDYL